jgi:hypothetical protein
MSSSVCAICNCAETSPHTIAYISIILIFPRVTFTFFSRSGGNHVGGCTGTFTCALSRMSTNLYSYTTYQLASSICAPSSLRFCQRFNIYNYETSEINWLIMLCNWLCQTLQLYNTCFTDHVHHKAGHLENCNVN